MGFHILRFQLIYIFKHAHYLSHGGGGLGGWENNYLDLRLEYQHGNSHVDLTYC